MTERDSNCWVLVWPGGHRVDFDGEVHFPSEADAAKNVERYTNPGMGVPTPERLAKECVTLDCSCCETTFDEDGEGVIEHHESIESVRSLAASCGWHVAEDGTTTCEECTGGGCDCSEDLPVASPGAPSGQPEFPFGEAS